MNDDHWFIGTTLPRHQFDTIEEFKGSTIEFYLPVGIELRRPRHAKLAPGEYVEVQRPILDSYIFFRFTAQQAWLELQGGRYPVSPIRFGEAYAYVRRHDIERLRAMERSGEFNQSMKPTPLNINAFCSGDGVVVDEGLLQGVVGTFVKTTDKNNATIEVNGINVTIPFRLLRLTKL